MEISSTTFHSIGDYAFFECSGLTKFTMPNAGTPGTIGAYAFSATKLVTIDLSATSITTIGPFAFDEVNTLESIIFPTTLIGPAPIKQLAFYGTKLKHVILPAAVEQIF